MRRGSSDDPPDESEPGRLLLDENVAYPDTYVVVTSVALAASMLGHQPDTDTSQTTDQPTRGEARAALSLNSSLE